MPCCWDACTGSIPEELGGLSELQILFLHTNELTGEGCVKLSCCCTTRRSCQSRRLHLSVYSQLFSTCFRCAAFTGPIPKALGALSELKELYLSSNKLTGDRRSKAPFGMYPAYLPPTQHRTNDRIFSLIASPSCTFLNIFRPSTEL